MAKKLIKIALILFILLIPFVSISLIVKNNMMRFMDKEYAWYKQNKDYMESHNEYARVLIMGDSVAKVGWFPRELSDDSYNYSLGGVSPIEEYYYLKEYLKNNKAPEYIIFTQGMDHFWMAETIWDRSIYFHRMSVSDLNEIINVCDKYKDKEILGNKDRIDAFLYKIYSPSQYGTAFCNGLLSSKRFNENNQKIEEAIKNKGQVLISSGKNPNSSSDIAKKKRFNCNIVINKYFEQIIDICIDNNIGFVFQSPPLNKATYESLSEPFLKEYQKYMESIQKKYPQTKIDQTVFYYDNKYFEDSVHLNEEGVHKYTSEMKNKYKRVFKETK